MKVLHHVNQFWFESFANMSKHFLPTHSNDYLETLSFWSILITLIRNEDW